MPIAGSRIAIWLCACTCAFGLIATAQERPEANLPQVNISAKGLRDPVQKSYRQMIRGMDLFEREHATSPRGTLRFKLLPRRYDTDMKHISLQVIGDEVAFPVLIAPDQTFTLERNQQALDEDAQVMPDRKVASMTWRSEIVTPGLPPNTRRLGDLRLECRVGMEAGLVSNSSNVLGRLVRKLMDTPAYCDSKVPEYLFFAERPLFGVTLVSGTRREALSVDQLYAGAITNPGLKDELPRCDCEILVDRTYFLPLGDRSWPDDTLVEFDDMEAP